MTVRLCSVDCLSAEKDCGLCLQRQHSPYTSTALHSCCSSTTSPHLLSPVCVVQSLWKKPSPAFHPRSLLKGAGGVTALPPFHFFSSSPAQSSSSPTNISPSHDLDNPAAPAWTHPPPSAYTFSPISSPRSGFTSPSLSPGPNIRRLAEQFLNSLPDDSPASGNRSISRQPSSRAAQQRLHPQVQQEESKADAEEERGAESDEAVVDMRVTEEAIDDTSAWSQLHEECLTFTRLCTTDASAQRKLRDELVARTRWSIRAVWPQAEVDLVGSVAAGVALPKSDLDFVIWFEKGKEAPKSYSYTTAPSPPAPPELPFVVLGEAEGERAGTKDADGPSRSPLVGYSTIATASPLSTTSTLSLTSNSSISSHSSASSTLTSPTSSSASFSSSSSPTLQYFAHAGALIKLIGGRKKSKLLFRSTKIQVFKDINLIRLRDGCSGISMDLWFPADPSILTRSQQHTQLLRQYAEEWKWFIPLAFVIKTFMQQHLLNSGYSGLGSYGILLMIVRFLQEDKARREDKGEEEESNVGRVLCNFFRFWVEFDYINFALDVKGQGRFTDKPDLNESAKSVKREESDDEAVPEEEDIADDDPQEVEGRGDDPSQRSRRRRKAVISGDRLSLVIADPCDACNYVICHHKALRNMLYAFIHACTVLDPLSPPPRPAKDVQAVAAFTEAELHSSPASAASSTAPSSSVSAFASAASTAPPTPSMSAPSSTPPSASATPMSTTNTSPTSSPILPSSSLPPLHSSSSLKSRFHRLIDIYHARLGPSMKLCPSLTCLNSDGSSTLCPVQNKVCYTCGHVFIKHGAAGGSAPNAQSGSLKQQRDRDVGAREELRAAGKPRGRLHRGRGQFSGPEYRAMGGRGMGGPMGHGPPLNQVGVGGMIANTNGMKFVSPPPLSPTVPSITPAAAAGGFIYVQSPQGGGVGGGVPPSAFNLSMAVSPYYPAGVGGGGGYYGGGPNAYERGYGGGGYGGYQGGGKRGGRHSRGVGGHSGGGMGMGGGGFGGVMPQYYAEPVAPYVPAPSYYGSVGHYAGGPGMGNGRY